MRKASQLSVWGASALAWISMLLVTYVICRKKWHVEKLEA